MKKLFALVVIVVLTISVFAQSPEKMSYQAVIRNTSNALVTNHSLGMRISILQGSATGTAVYVETQTPTTNANGLATIEVGGGTPVTGTFAGIDWSTGTYFIKTETDPTGGVSYTITGTSQVLSVPYALYAKTAGNGSLWSQSGSNIYFNSGRVGIGTSDPTTYLHAHGSPVTSRGQLSLSAPAGEGTFISFYEENTFKAYLWYDVSDQDLLLQNFTAGDLNLNPYGGKVGIGTNTPGYTLDVSGDINFTGTLTNNGSPFASSWTNIIGKPTTVSGYGITDAVIITGDQTITGIKTFSSDIIVNGLTVGKGKSSASGNTAIGINALKNNTTAVNNTAIGMYALSNSTTGNSNTAIGSGTLWFNTTGFFNTATGMQALVHNTEGERNTANGALALPENTTGSNNTATGHDVLHNNTTGNYNTASGTQSLFSNTTGSHNTAYGPVALHENSTGNNNTAIGWGAGHNNATGNNNVFLGYRAGHYETGSNKLFIDNQTRASESDAITKSLIYGVFDANPANQVLTINGNVGIGTPTPNYTLDVRGTIGNNITLYHSDIRWKTDIQPMNYGIKELIRLNSISYLWNKDDYPEMGFDREKQFGFIAQEFEKVIPELVKTDKDGYKSIDYVKLTPVIVEAIKEQQKQIESEKQENQQLKSELKELKSLVNALIANQSAQVEK